MEYRIESGEFYAIELLDSGKVIGNIYCGNRDYEAREFGYIVKKLYQCKGYAVCVIADCVTSYDLMKLDEMYAYYHREELMENIPQQIRVKKTKINLIPYLLQRMMVFSYADAKDFTDAEVWKKAMEICNRNRYF